MSHGAPKKDAEAEHPPSAGRAARGKRNKEPGSNELAGACRHSGSKGEKAPTSEELAGASTWSGAKGKRARVADGEAEKGVEEEVQKEDGVVHEGLIKEHLLTITQNKRIEKSVPRKELESSSDVEMVLNNCGVDEPVHGDISVSADKDTFSPQFGDFSDGQEPSVVQKLGKDYIAVKELDSNTVISMIVKIMSLNATKILEGKGYSYDIPKCGTKMLSFHDGTPQVVFKHGGTILREFGGQDIYMATATACVLSTVHKVLEEGVAISSLVLFNLYKTIFGKPETTDRILTDVCCMLECTGSSLNVVCESKGSVIGPLTLIENGISINCLDKSLDGIGIPYNTSDIEFEIRKDEVEFILVVEKYSVFHNLSQRDFHTENKCIMITGDGEPDIATRAFLKRLVDVTRLTAWALVDPDAHGVQILCSYAFGPTKMSYASLGLAVPSIRWLGVLPGDLASLTELDHSHFSNFSERETKILKNLIKHNRLVLPNLWVQRIEQLISENRKTAIESLHSLGFCYLSKVFLPKLLRMKRVEPQQVLGREVIRPEETGGP
ncbi:hypothetical protein ACP70R_030723 [Stipagrostis hirtigluma subsp. patula]